MAMETVRQSVTHVRHPAGAAPSQGRQDAGVRPPPPATAPDRTAAPATTTHGQAELAARLADLCRTLEALGRAPSAQGERLLTLTDVADVLRVSLPTACRMMPRLIAAGLKKVEIPAVTRRADRDRKARRAVPMKRYTASSLLKVIARAADRERPLC